MLMALQQAPEGFYIVEQEEIWEGLIDPDIMTMKQLDQAVIEGLAEWRKYGQQKKGWFRTYLPVMVAIGVGAVAVAMVAAPIAAGGAVTAATQTTTAATAAGTATAKTAITGAKALALAQKGAALVKKKGKVLQKVIGKNDAQRLINAADIISSSPNVTDAAMGVVKSELAAYGDRILTKKSEDALRERIKREQELYGEYMRRQGYGLQEEITAGVTPRTLPQTTETPNWTTILAVATPFILFTMGGR